ncbi:MAG: hypothetical protein CMP84_04810 [Gammaproteobacteria bacterium]|nr:hypothetical protein [Gammaproteobacteria bacterium]
MTLRQGPWLPKSIEDKNHRRLTPSGRILSAWIYNGQPSDIESGMVDDKFVMRDRSLTILDETALLGEAHRIGERVWSRILRDGPLPLPSLKYYRWH